MNTNVIEFIAETLRMERIPRDRVLELCTMLRDVHDMLHQLQQTTTTLNNQVTRLTQENKFLISYLNDLSLDLDDHK